MLRWNAGASRRKGIGGEEWRMGKGRIGAVSIHSVRGLRLGWVGLGRGGPSMMLMGGSVQFVNDADGEGWRGACGRYTAWKHGTE